MIVTLSVVAKFATEMRAIPSVAYVSGLYVYNPISSNQPLNSVNAIGSGQATTSGGQFSGSMTTLSSTSAGMVAYTYQNTAGTGGFQFSAEL
jgi:hypothetical protein